MRPGVTDLEQSNEIGISTEVNFRLPENYVQSFFWNERDNFHLSRFNV